MLHGRVSYNIVCQSFGLQIQKHMFGQIKTRLVEVENFYKRQKYTKFAVNKFGLFHSPYEAFVGACKKLYTNMKSIYLIVLES